MKNLTRWSCLIAVLASIPALTGCGNAQSRKMGYIQHGQKYYAAGNYDKARLEFRNALQIDPKDAEVRFLLGQVAEKAGDARGAFGEYQASLNANPKQADARAALGRLYLYGGVPDKALELAESGLAAEPDNAQFLTVRGAARAQLGNVPAALQDAQRAVALAPADDYAIALLASLYKQRSELDQAVNVVRAGLQRLPNSADLRTIMADLELARQQPDEAEIQLQAIIALEPKVLLPRYRLAQFYLQQRNIDAAEKTIREAVAGFPDSNDAKLRLVEFLGSQRGGDAATAQVDEFIAHEAGNDQLKLALCGYLAQNGHADRAEQVLQEVISHAGTKPDGLAARNRLAALRLTGGDPNAASSLIAAVLKENPRDNDALILRSDIALASGDAPSAINDLRAVLRDQPNAVAVMRTLAQAYQQNNEPELAEETLRTAVQTVPKDFQSRLALAAVLARAGKLDQAASLLEQLAKENPADLQVQESLFRVQAAQKRYAEALATAQGIERGSPKSGLGYYLAGLIEEAEQKNDAALKDYDQALQRQPDAAEPLSAYVRLEVRLKHTDIAAARLDAAISRSPGNVIARDLKGDMLLAQGRLDASIAAYEGAVAASPDWAQGYHDEANALHVAMRDEDAVKKLQAGIDATHGAAVLVSDLANLYQHLGRTGDAIGLYEGMLQKNPRSTFAANNLAMLLVTYRQDPASLARAQKLADQLAASSEPTLIDTRGWVKFKVGDFHGAESLLQQAVDKAPAAPEMRYHLGMAQLRSGEQQAAEQSLESALGTNRPFAGMDEARATLAQLKKTPVG
jgi:tetratricopeptide (TPR) repeat protein